VGTRSGTANFWEVARLAEHTVAPFGRWRQAGEGAFLDAPVLFATEVWFFET